MNSAQSFVFALAPNTSFGRLSPEWQPILNSRRPCRVAPEPRVSEACASATVNSADCEWSVLPIAGRMFCSSKCAFTDAIAGTGLFGSEGWPAAGAPINARAS